MEPFTRPDSDTSDWRLQSYRNHHPHSESPEDANSNKRHWRLERHHSEYLHSESPENSIPTKSQYSPDYLYDRDSLREQQPYDDPRYKLDANGRIPWFETNDDPCDDLRSKPMFGDDPRYIPLPDTEPAMNIGPLVAASDQRLRGSLGAGIGLACALEREANRFRVERLKAEVNLYSNVVDAMWLTLCHSRTEEEKRISNGQRLQNNHLSDQLTPDHTLL